MIHHDQVPCFWLGRNGANFLQVHMPTHSRSNRHVPGKDLVAENVTHEMLWDHLCNTPTVLHWYKELPEDVFKPILETDFGKKGGRDYEKDFKTPSNSSWKGTSDRGEIYQPPSPDPSKETPSPKPSKKPHGGNEPDFRVQPPHPGLPPAFLASSEEGLTVEHKAVAKSAKMLCKSRTAAGPDYVNVPEGLFCRSKSFSQDGLFSCVLTFEFPHGDSVICDLFPFRLTCRREIANLEYQSGGQKIVPSL